MNQHPTSALAQVDPRFAKRRKILLAVIGLVLLTVLIIAALSIRSCVIDRGVRRDLGRAAELVATDTAEAHDEALALVDRLHQEHPDRPDVSGRYAWHHYLYAKQVGPAEEHLQAARSAAEAADQGPQDVLLLATRAGLLLEAGQAPEAEAQARAILEQASTCRECGYVRALCLVALGRGAEAALQLDLARQGVPPFLPALAALADTLRDQGRFAESRAALTALRQLEANHLGAKVLDVLVELEELSASGAPLPAKSLAPLKQRLAQVSIDDRYALRAAVKHYTAGRLALAEGADEAASAELGVAAGLLANDQTIARWRAVAQRHAGQHLEALESLAAFPDSDESQPELLRTRAEVLLDLQRTTDAAAPIALLTKQKIQGALRLEGRQKLLAGETDEAGRPLRTALTRGDREAALELAEAYLLLGQAHDAQKILEQAAQTEDAIGLCAEGYREQVRGSTKRAQAKLEAAVKAGGRCGHSLAGRLLIGTGEDGALLKGVVAALAKREDLRDRVALGRLKLRAEGAQAARGELDRVRKLGPQGAVVLAELAQAYEEFDPATAAEVAREGVTLTKGHPFLTALAARLAREADQLDQAEQILEKAPATGPHKARVLLEKAAVLYARRRYVQAAEAIEAALADGPSFSEGACLQATIQERRGNVRDAQIELAKAIARTLPRSGFAEVAPARICLAESYIRRGRPSFGKARAQLGLLSRRGMLWDEIPYLFGILALRQNENDRAAKQFRRALEYDITHRKSWDSLSHLGALGPEDFERFGRLWPDRQLSKNAE